MFGPSTSPEYVFNVYHDESGTYVPNAGDRWLLHGVLFIPKAKQNEVYAALQQVRQDIGYFEEVHYVKLRGHLAGPKVRCAKSWLNLYGKQFSEFCFYHCLAVDTHSPGFEHRRFGEPHHAYNRFARMAIEGAIAWGLKGYQHVALKFYSDGKFRQQGDNFATYIPNETYASITEKRHKNPGNYPEIRFIHPTVISVNSNPSHTDPNLLPECEMIQLVDLMTSNIVQALDAQSGQIAKIALAETIAQWIEDTRRPPWLQTKELHRRFSVSCFPDAKGQFYNPSLAIVNRNQFTLFEE